MSNLETFIKENREVFDSLEPSSTLWDSIDAQFKTPKGTTSKISWLKKLILGTSVITGIVMISYNAVDKTTEKNKPKKNIDLVLENSQTEEELSVQKNIDENVLFRNPINSANDFSSLLPIPIINSTKIQPIFSQVYPNLEHRIETKNIPKMLTKGQSEICACGNKKGDFILNDTVFNGIKEIEICSNYADINIIGNEDDQTFLDFQYITPEEKKKKKIVKVEQNKIFYEIVNSKLTLSVKYEKNTYINKGFNSIRQIKLNLRIPKSTLLAIRNSNGEVSIDHISNNQSSIRNENGNIRVSDLTSDLKVDSRMGDIEIKNSQGKLNAECGLGDLKIVDYTGNIDVNSSNGNSIISILKGNLSINSSLGNQEFSKITGNINSQSTSGDLKFYECDGNLEVESSLGDQSFQTIKGTITSKSSSGDLKIMSIIGDVDVTSELGNTIIEGSIGNLKIESNSGDIKGKNIELLEKTFINSSLGDINLSLVNKIEDLSFDLKTELGYIEITKEDQQYSESDKLFISKGKIMIQIRSNSGNINLK
jgi:hypothetical protein